jgi:hypothetical protein
MCPLPVRPGMELSSTQPHVLPPPRPSNPPPPPVGLCASLCVVACVQLVIMDQITIKTPKPKRRLF